MGYHNSQYIIQKLKEENSIKNLSLDELQNKLSSIIQTLLEPSNKSFELQPNQLNIILLCGVNGNGKTTSIAKLAAAFMKDNKKVMIAACDTFRAAAVSQLQTWADNINCPIVIGAENQDPASVAYKALQQSLEDNYDILLIDTAGRLNNKTNLMEELAKIIRVVEKLQKIDHKILVVDANTGQNIVNQVNQFNAAVNLDGLIVTKLDGTAKAGALVNVLTTIKLPIYFVGTGEKIDDWQSFDIKKFTDGLVS
jgi:fused signal recognition particle receptor